MFVLYFNLLEVCIYNFVAITFHSFIPLAYAECVDSLPFSGASSIPVCYISFPSTLFHQPVFHPPSLHPAIYFLFFLLTLFQNSYFLGILFSSILCTCPNWHNLFNLIVSVIVDFLTIAYIYLMVNILQFSFSFSYTGPKILLYTFLSKMFICFLSLVGIQVSDAYVKVFSIIVFFSLNFSFLRYIISKKIL